MQDCMVAYSLIWGVGITPSEWLKALAVLKAYLVLSYPSGLQVRIHLGAQSLTIFQH